MAHSSKWLDHLSAETSVSEAARLTLSQRIRLVHYYLPRAAGSPEDDVEYVHQLRVSSRRTVAATRVYAEQLPDRRAKTLVKWLNRIRRAAGPARDDDVLALRLAGMLKNEPDPGVASLLAEVQAHRQRAQKPLKQIARRLKARRFRSRSERWISKARWREDGPEPNLHAVACLHLRRVMTNFLAAAQQDLRTDENLHQLRIEGKKLRYSMEIFSAAFPPSFRNQLYRSVTSLQEHLGEVNDHAVAIERFHAWQATTSDRSATQTLTSMIEGEKAALAQSRQQFFAWWSDNRQPIWDLGFRI